MRLAAVTDRRYSAKANWKRYEKEGRAAWRRPGLDGLLPGEEGILAGFGVWPNTRLRRGHQLGRRGNSISS